MRDSKIVYRRKAIPEGQGAGRAADQLDFAANFERSVSKLICSRGQPASHLQSSYTDVVGFIISKHEGEIINAQGHRVF